MPVNTREIVELAAEVSRINGLRITVRESMKGGLLAGISTVLGGMILGPIGLAVGGTVGGITAAMVSNNFRSAADIILNELTVSQQALLVNRLQSIVNNLRIEDATLLLPLVLNNEAICASVLSSVTEFLRNDMSLSIC